MSKSNQDEPTHPHPVQHDGRDCPEHDGPDHGCPHGNRYGQGRHGRCSRSKQHADEGGNGQHTRRGHAGPRLPPHHPPAIPLVDLARGEPSDNYGGALKRGQNKRRGSGQQRASVAGAFGGALWQARLTIEHAVGIGAGGAKKSMTENTRAKPCCSVPLRANRAAPYGTQKSDVPPSLSLYVCVSDTACSLLPWRYLHRKTSPSSCRAARWVKIAQI